MDYGKIHKRLGKDSICVPFKKQNKNQYTTFQLISHDYSHSKTHQTLLDIHFPPHRSSLFGIDAICRSPRGVRATHWPGLVRQSCLGHSGGVCEAHVPITRYHLFTV